MGYACVDFSHSVIKAANSFECGNLIGIVGHPMDIYMLRDCYLKCPDMKTHGKDYLNKSYYISAKMMHYPK